MAKAKGKITGATAMGITTTEKVKLTLSGDQVYAIHAALENMAIHNKEIIEKAKNENNINYVFENIHYFSQLALEIKENEKLAYEIMLTAEKQAPVYSEWVSGE